MVSTTKINSTLPLNTLKTSPNKSKKSNEKFNTKDSPQAAPLGETYQTFAVSGLSALFLDDAPKQKNPKKAVVYGNELLDQLEKIRNSLILGSLSYDDLTRLMETLQNRPPLKVDLDLENLIREIETRAAVELAKLGV